MPQLSYEHKLNVIITMAERRRSLGQVQKRVSQRYNISISREGLRTVWFTDESQFETLHRQHSSVRRRRGEARNQENIIPTLPHGGGLPLCMGSCWCGYQTVSNIQ